MGRPSHGADSVGLFVGRDAVVEFLTAFWDEQTDQRRHIFTNVVVSDLTGTSGVVHTYLLLTSSTPTKRTQCAGSGRAMLGRYRSILPNP